MTTQDRLIAYARRHARSERRQDLLIQVAAAKVVETLGYLRVGSDEISAAEHEYLAANPQMRPGARFSGRLPHAFTSGEDADRHYEESRRTYSLLQYRIDTFYVFVGILLDDIAAMVSRALGRGLRENHTELTKRLPAAAVALGIDGYEPVVERAQALMEVKDFRDDFVVHRGSKNPRLTRALSTFPDGAVRMNLSGLMYPKEGEEPQLLESEDPLAVLARLDDYIEAVLDLLETLAR